MNTSMLGTLDEEHKIQYLFNLAKEHRDRVKTFSELFEDIKVQEKECKTMQKMTLKQLEAKKKERLLINPEGNNYSKPVRIQTEKYDKLKIIDNTSIFELYEASLNPKIKLSDHGRQWEEMLETDFKLMKANRAKTENESHLAVPVKQLSKSRRLSINMNALKVDDTIERNKTINGKQIH